MKMLIVGLGSIGYRHALNAAKTSGIETAVFDTDSGRSEKTGDHLDAISFNDWENALAWRPHAAVVAVPTNLHISVARDLVGIGAHVLIEKPISHQIEGVDDLLKLAVKNKCKVRVVCNMRFHPAIKVVRDYFSEIGKPLFARAHYGNYLPDMRPGIDYRDVYCSRRDAGGGVILDGIHEVDYLTWLFGSVKAISCESAKLSDLNIDVEDYAHMIMRHANGFRSEVHLDYLRRSKRRGLEVLGSEGILLWQSEGKTPEQCKVSLHTIKNGWKTLLNEPTLNASFIYAELLGSFIREVQGVDGDMLLSGDMARHELAAVLAAHQSSVEGKVINV